MDAENVELTHDCYACVSHLRLACVSHLRCAWNHAESEGQCGVEAGVSALSTPAHDKHMAVQAFAPCMVQSRRVSCVIINILSAQS